MNCPKCQTELRAVTARGVNLGICDLCHGVWLDRDHLLKVADLDNAQLQALFKDTAQDNRESSGPDHQGGVPACPRCGTPLQATVYCCDSGVNIDNCPRCCGNWLNDGEFGRLIDYRRRNRVPPPPEQAEMINAKLRQIEDDFRERDEEMIAGLVKLDTQPGIRGIPGKILHSMYRLFHRIGL